MSDQYTIYGGFGSPYSMKMKAILTYRRISHRFQEVNLDREPVAHVRPAVIPVIQFPDGEYHVDSTPMIDALESLHPERGIVPPDPADAYLAYLIEDLADEWATKMMFHYRWFREIDQRTCSRFLAFDMLGSVGRDRIESTAAIIRERQVGRMALVGCTEGNQALIESTCLELLDLLEGALSSQRYLFGSRPSRADFGLFGQLSQLANDPTSAALLAERAPLTYRWVHQLYDASGVDGDWQQPDLEGPIRGLLQLAGDVYFPFLEANAAAFEAGEESFSFEARGLGYEQSTFKYQVRCLAALRSGCAALAPEPLARIEPLLRETGCWDTLAAS
jgi:glutathione S-transferase